MASDSRVHWLVRMKPEGEWEYWQEQYMIPQDVESARQVTKVL